MWYTCGGRNNIIKNDDISIANILITLDKNYLLATTSDADRIMVEELSGLNFELVLHNWYNENFFNSLKKIKEVKKIGGDFEHPNIINLESELSDIRMSLTEFEIKRLKKNCLRYSKFLTDYCLGLKPGISEEKISNELNYICLNNNIYPITLMVGSDERIFRYRHPLPTKKIVEKYLLIATVAEMDGINISISRSIYFGHSPKELLEKQKVVNYIECFLYHYSIPGRKIKELFDLGKKAYYEAGYPDEWSIHPFGGIAGYKPRELLVNENQERKVRENDLFGWNPTIKGAKAEDFAIVKENSIEQLSIDKNWPYEEINIDSKKYLKPIILELS